MEVFVAPAEALAMVRWQMVNKWLFRMAGGGEGLDFTICQFALYKRSHGDQL